MKRKKGESMISYHGRLDKRDATIAMVFSLLTLGLVIVGILHCIF